MNLQFSTACAAATLVAALGMPMLASGKPTTLLTTELEGMEGMEVNVVLFEEKPGKVYERHIHPGNLFIYVLDGTIRAEVEGQEPMEATAGEVIHESPTGRWSDASSVTKVPVSRWTVADPSVAIAAAASEASWNLMVPATPPVMISVSVVMTRYIGSPLP